ncbi:carbohydrate binding domain protein [Yersinia ruckeri]|uniref:M60 family metallopeptidase n=1 Tax=Yersinia ruckeri TaxID=29486 RepID=UPI0005AC7F01|nr:M60 family metallopeptidase [Yersinia ruckeri]AJI95063.1 carbohydrate binding domain protein [Yersinia ruckeri]MCW6569592.1 M60 family metallopeptidase [Yersinia ruckeri]
MLHPVLRTTPIAVSLLLALGFSSTLSAAVSDIPVNMSVQQAEMVKGNNTTEASRQISLVQHGSPVFLNEQHRRHMFTHPTQSSGFWANKGDILRIDYQHQGEDIDVLPELWIVPVTKGDEATFDRQVVKLQQGVNEIKVENTGPIYFVATNQPGSSEMAVNLLEGGKPMPRFILGENTAEDWQAQLVKFGDAPFAELVGKRMILTMPIDDMRKQVTDPESVLTLWDRIVDLAEEQYGLGNDRAFPHRATPFQYQFVSKPDNTAGYMSASNYWLGTNASGIAQVINSQKLQNEGWGPWHELGHHYQMPAWTFNDDIETTVNLTALYVQRELQGTTRLEIESRWENIHAYLATQKNNYDNCDAAYRLAMFWQLDLAFGKDFYQRLGDRYRTLLPTEQPKTNDEKKQRFILETSRIAGFSLLQFFQTWGIKPSKETREQLRAMNLQVLDMPIWRNKDSQILFSYPLSQQNITGNVQLPATANAGEVFTVSVDVTNRPTSALTYQWDIPEGVEIIADNGKEITLRTPRNVLQNAMLSIPVTVTDSNNMAIRLASSIQLKTAGKNESTREAYNEAIKQRYQIEGDFNSWSETSPKGIPGTFYLYDNHYTNTRDYFRLKTKSYWYFPTDQTSNNNWEYLDSYDGSQYLSNQFVDLAKPIKMEEKPAQCSVMAWSNTAYVGGSKVSKDGNIYVSKWWADAEAIPGDARVTDTTGNGTGWGKVWEDQGACDTAAQDELAMVIQSKPITESQPVAAQQCSAPSWQQQSYNGQVTVSKEGRVYTSKWWVAADAVPGDASVTDKTGDGTGWGLVWEDKGAC